MKLANETANINVNLYDKEFTAGFDCVGAKVCRFALCPMMPPDGDEECFFREYGSCKHKVAQLAALQQILNKIKREIKQYEDEA